MIRGHAGQASAPEQAQRLTTEATRLEDGARAARRVSDFDTARAQFEAAIDLLGEQHPTWRSRLHVQLSRVLTLSGDPDASLRQARAAVDAAPTGAAKAFARSRLAVCLSHLGRVEEATRAARQAVAMARAAGDVEAEGTARMALGYALRYAGRPVAAAVESRAAVENATATGDDEALVARLIDLANSLHLAGDIEGAVQAARKSVAEARRRSLAIGMPTAVHALYLFNAGRWQACLAAIRDGLAADRDVPWLVLMRAQVLIGRGELATARRQLARAERLVGGPRAGGWDGPHETAAELLLWAGQPERALARVREALETIQVVERSDAVRDLVVLGLRAVGDMRSEEGRADAQPPGRTADRLIDLMRRHAALMRQGHPDDVGLHLLAAEALAEAEYARARGLQAPDLWERAAELQHEMGNPWRTAYSRYRTAQALLRDGASTARADACLAEAYRTAVRLRAPLLRRVVEKEAVAWGRPLLPPQSVPSTVSAPREPRGLTPRERQVLGHLALGASNRQIADALGISDKTVSVHIGNINGKLGVANRLEAASVAIRLSMASPLELGGPRQIRD